MPKHSHTTVSGEVPPTHLKCPQCPVVLYKRKLFIHVQRKHGQEKDLTEFHLQPTSVDWSNSLQLFFYLYFLGARRSFPALHTCSRWFKQNLIRTDGRTTDAGYSIKINQVKFPFSAGLPLKIAHWRRLVVILVTLSWLLFNCFSSWPLWFLRPISPSNSINVTLLCLDNKMMQQKDPS